MALPYYAIDSAIRSVDQNARWLARNGNSVRSGCSVTTNSGELGQSDTLTVAPESGSEAVIDGTQTTINQQAVGLETADAIYPRFDTIYLDSNGVAQAAAGTPSPVISESENPSRDEAARPAPEPLANAGPVVILAIVWVPGGSSTISDNEVFDRSAQSRQPYLEADQIIATALDVANATVTTGLTVDSVTGSNSSTVTIENGLVVDTLTGTNGTAITVQNGAIYQSGGPIQVNDSVGWNFGTDRDFLAYWDDASQELVMAENLSSGQQARAIWPDGKAPEYPTGIDVGANNETSIGSDGSITAPSASVSGAFDAGGTGFSVDAQGDVRTPSVDAPTVEQGDDPATTFTETTSPTGFGFSASGTIDLHTQTDVTISNPATTSQSEDVTVTLYDGVDNTGTQLLSQTRSVSRAAGASSITTFIATNQELDRGDYYIEVVTSGTTLSVDQTDEYTRGAEYTTSQNGTGDLVTTDQFGRERRRFDAATDTASFPAVETAELSNTPAEGVPQSLYSSISQGNAVASAPGGALKSVDFSNFATDDAALQALVNWLEANHPNGEIYVPVVTGDGTELTIENTVAQDTAIAQPISFYFIGGGESQAGAQRVAVRTTINDGSPMFDLSGEIGGLASQSIKFHGQAFNLDFNDATVVRCRNMNKPWIQLGAVHNFYGDAVVFGTGSFVYRVNQTYFLPNDGQTDSNGNPAPTARCIVTEDNETSSGVSPGSDGVIAPTVSCETEHAVGVANVGGHKRLTIGGHWEGAYGTAEFVSEAGPRNNGDMYLGPMATVAVTHNGAHGLYHNSPGIAIVRPHRIGGIAGDAVHMGTSTGPFKIGAEIRFNASNITGDSIHIASTPTQLCFAPYENSVAGTVTYPSSPRNYLAYPDGRLLYRSGTTTVTANSSVTANSFAGNNNRLGDIEIGKAATPAGDTEYTYRRGVDASNGHETLIIENLGANDLDVSWRIYRRA